MVDRQTPTVESDEELTREARAERETETEREVEPTADQALVPSHEATPAPEGGATADSGSGRETALFDRDASRDLEERWLVIQTQFVDEPRRAVEKAEQLVGEVMKGLTDSFARERRDLESRWAGDRDVSTEELRLAIRRYRSFFNRLLSL
jgi:hypothetical protein